MKFAGSIVILFLIVSASVAEGAKTKTKAIQPLPRTEVRVPAAVKAKMKDLSAVLQMVSITPLVNDSDEVVGMELLQNLAHFGFAKVTQETQGPGKGEAPNFL